MTLSASDVWTTYRKSVGASNHDGSFTLPENVDDLGDRQRGGWQAVANLGNQHASEAIEPVRKRLRDENVKLRQQLGERDTELAKYDAMLEGFRDLVLKGDKGDDGMDSVPRSTQG